MDDDAGELRRVRFFGANDLATGWYVPRVVELVEQLDPSATPTSTLEVLELHNVQKYLEHGYLPKSYTQKQRDDASARISEIRSTVARHFSVVNQSNFAQTVIDVSHEYHADLLELLARNGAFARCESATALTALTTIGVHLGELLACKSLVHAYDLAIRELLQTSPQGAEYLVRHFLEGDRRTPVYLPPSLTSADSREILQKYIDDENAHPNYVKLIATSKQTARAGIDAKLQLRARRRHEAMTAEIFKGSKGLRTGCEMSIAESQDEAVIFELDTSDGFVERYIYGKWWLDESLDYPSVLNNFVHLFEYVDRQAMLVMPSHPSHLGVIEGLLGTRGKDEYRLGTIFRSSDMRTRLQMQIYIDFLNASGVDLEAVVAWFFDHYLTEEFQAKNFSFSPSGLTTPYLQRVRNLFAEMESVANQFAMFARDGEVDRELLALGSDQVRYKEIPSLLEGKYIYAAEDGDVLPILYQLFSDQSGLGYIGEDLRGNNAAELLISNNVAYEDFREDQRPMVDFLIERAVLKNLGTRVAVINTEQFKILSALFYKEAASYYHLSAEGRAEADAMAAKGWITRESSLLTRAEGDYFNYFLNAVDFSNGPQLRNKYLHGAQVGSAGDDAHLLPYIIAMRLTVALVIKINDDFCLATAEGIAEQT